MDGGLRPERRVVQEGPQRPVFGGGEEVGILLLIGDVVVPVAGVVVNAGDRVAVKTGESGLRLDGGGVDRRVHRPGKHEGGVVTPAAPLALHPSRRVRLEPELSKVRDHLRPGFQRSCPHVLDRRRIEGVVEGGEAVRGGRPLGRHVGVAAHALGRADELVRREPSALDLGANAGRALPGRLRGEFSRLRAGDDARRQVGPRARRGRGREERTLGRHEPGRDEVRLDEAGHVTVAPSRTFVQTPRERGLGLRGELQPAVRETVPRDENDEHPPGGEREPAGPHTRRTRVAHKPVPGVGGDDENGAPHMGPPRPAVLPARRRREDEESGEDEDAAHEPHPGPRQDRGAVLPLPDGREVRGEEPEHDRGQQEPHARVGEHHRLKQLREGVLPHREELDPESVRDPVREQVERVRQHEDGHADPEPVPAPLPHPEDGAQHRPLRPGAGALPGLLPPIRSSSAHASTRLHEATRRNVETPLSTVGPAAGFR